MHARDEFEAWVTLYLLVWILICGAVLTLCYSLGVLP